MTITDEQLLPTAGTAPLETSGDVREADMNSVEKRNNGIGYFICSNIQHVPPIVQIYPHLGGIVITTNPSIRDIIQGKYAHLNMPVIFCESLSEAKQEAIRLRLRVIVHTGYKLLKCGKSVQVFHGGLSDKRYLECSRLVCYDLVFFPGQKSHDKVELAATLNWIKEWHLVGYPKFDPVVRGEHQAAKLFDNDRKTILYAPTWVSQWTKKRLGERSEHGESSLAIWSLAIIERLSDKYNLILKYHSHLNEDKSSIYQDILQLIEKKNLVDTVKPVVDDNIVPYMAAADLMISDISSVCYEWLHFDRPILFANPAPGKYHPGTKITDNTYVWQAGEVINDPDEIRGLVERNLAEDSKSEVRKKIFKYAVHQPDGHAAERQVVLIKDLYERVKDKNWRLFSIQCWMSRRFKRILARIFQTTKGLPR